MKESKLMSVITLPLKVEPWQADILNKRMELCRRVYNSILKEKLQSMSALESDSEYQAAIQGIKQVYQISDEKLKAKELKSETFKGYRMLSSSMLKEAEISEYAFIADATRKAKLYSENLSANMAIYSIAKPLWTSFDSYLYGGGAEIHEKKYGDINSLATDGKSGIRITNDDGATLRSKIGGERAYIICGTKSQKCLKLPILVDSKDTYLKEMLDRNVKIVRILRKKINENYKYYLQLSVEGAPAEKKDVEGHILHEVNTGAIGIYIDTRYLVIANAKCIHTIDLNFDTEYSLEIEQILRYMERSSRISNPDNFTENGNLRKTDNEEELTWKYSKRYAKARKRLNNLKRIEAERRKIRSYTIANEVLSHGSDIVINDYSFKGAEMRIYDESSGRYKKKAGSVIAANVPAQILTIIDKKLIASGHNKMIRKHITVDFTIPDYRAYYARYLLDSTF